MIMNIKWESERGTYQHPPKDFPKQKEKPADSISSAGSFCFGYKTKRQRERRNRRNNLWGSVSFLRV